MAYDPTITESSIAQPSHPLLLGLYHVVPLDEDRVQVCNAGRSVVLRGPGFAEKVMPLLDALDGTNSAEELAARFPDLAAGVLEGLARKGLLVEGDGTPMDRGPAELTAAALGELAPGFVATRLAEATVALSGCGPVSATAAVLLAKAGVGRLVLADDGEVTPRDMAVTPMLAPVTIGSSRARVIGDLCRAAGALSVDFTGPRRSDSPVDAADLMVMEGRDGSGIPLAHEADVALATGTPCLLHSQDALEALVGPTIRPGGDPCHRCVETRRLGHVDDLEEFMAYRRHRATRQPFSDAFLAAHTSFVAGVVATDAIRVLLGLPHLTDRSAAVIDLARMTVVTEEILPVPGCPTCSSAP